MKSPTCAEESPLDNPASLYFVINDMLEEASSKHEAAGLEAPDELYIRFYEQTQNLSDQEFYALFKEVVDATWLDVDEGGLILDGYPIDEEESERIKKETVRFREVYTKAKSLYEQKK